MTSVISFQRWFDSLTLRRQYYFPVALGVCSLWRGMTVSGVLTQIKNYTAYLYIRKSNVVGFLTVPRSGVVTHFSSICLHWIFLGAKVKWKCESLSHIWLFMTPWTVAHQALLLVEFSSLEYWSGLPFPSPGTLSDPEIEPGSPLLQAIFFTLWATTEAIG